MSWVEVPPGVKMPTTTTYERWRKRNEAKFNSWWDKNHTDGATSSKPKKKGRWDTDDPIEWRVNQLVKKHPEWNKGGKLKAKSWVRKNDKYGRMASRLQATHKLPSFEIIKRMKAAGAKPSTGRSGGSNLLWLEELKP